MDSVDWTSRYNVRNLLLGKICIKPKKTTFNNGKENIRIPQEIPEERNSYGSTTSEYRRYEK